MGILQVRNHVIPIGASLLLTVLLGCSKATYTGMPAGSVSPEAPVPEPLLLVEVDPSDGATGIPGDRTIEARFSRAPNPATVTTATFRLIDEATETLANCRIEAVIEEPGEPATLFRLIPREPLELPDHPYRIELEPSIAAADGTILDLGASPVVPPCRFVTGQEPDTVPPFFFLFMHNASAVSPTAVRLSWFPAFDDRSPPLRLRYAIYAGTAPDTIDLDSPVASPASGLMEVTVGGLSPDTTYHFVIHAIDEAGNEDDNEVTVSARTWPPGPTELTILYTADVFATLEPCG